MITLEDTTPPTFTQPADITIECDVDPTDLTIVGDVIDEADNCDTSLADATYNDAVQNDTPCIGASTITRFWTLIDACGNSKILLQTITLEDTTPPTFVTPADVTLECDVDNADLAITGDVTLEADNCDTTIGQATFTDSIEVSNACAGNLTIFRIWTLSDNCGNTTTDIQTILVGDNIAPTFTVPNDIVIQCNLDPDDLAIVGDVTDEADNCDTTLGQATYTDAIATDDPCIGAAVITRTWSLTDECGNNTTAIQIITLEDTVAPTLLSLMISPSNVMSIQLI